mgnify:CR=1 FL=1
MVNYLSVPPTLQRPCWYVGSLVSGILHAASESPIHVIPGPGVRVFGSGSDPDSQSLRRCRVAPRILGMKTE